MQYDMRSDSVIIWINIVWILACMLCGYCSKDNTSPRVRWYIKTKPIVFGGTAELFCNGTLTEQCVNCTEKITWLKEVAIIIYQGTSVNNSKYEQTEEDFGVILLIKKFGEQDVNVMYTCVINYISYSAILDFDNDTFELRPSKEDVTITEHKEGDNVIFAIGFGHIFPIPSCRFHTNNRELPAKFEYHTERESIFYNLTMETTLKRTDLQCARNISIACFFKDRQIVSFDRPCLQKELEQYDTAVSNILGGIIGGVLSLLFILVVFFLVRKCKYKAHFLITEEREMRMI